MDSIMQPSEDGRFSKCVHSCHKYVHKRVCKWTVASYGLILSQC